MTNYDPGKWAGLSQLDGLIAFNKQTGKPTDILAAVDDVARMAVDADVIVWAHMANVPESVRQTLWLLAVATSTLAMIIRARVVTEAIPVANGEK